MNTSYECLLKCTSIRFQEKDEEDCIRKQELNFGLCGEIFNKKSSYTIECNTQKPEYRPNQSPSKRPDSQQSSKKDDHFTHKGKVNSRQRSHSKDSNDDFENKREWQQNSCGNNEPCGNNEVNQSKSSDDKRNNQQYSSETTNTEPDDNEEAAVSEPFSGTVVTSHPIVIDQILTGSELDLKSFIGENRSDPIVSSIAKSLSTNAKKPKLAANISEAKRLMKVRKQIDLQYQKKIGNIHKEFFFRI